jgi:hypothetical protein
MQPLLPCSVSECYELSDDVALEVRILSNVLSFLCIHT